MSKNEDAVPLDYAYSWSEVSNLSLEGFLAKYRPSMVQNDGTKHWIWVRGTGRPIHQPEEKGEQEALKEASTVLKEVTDEVESIKNDASIPLRSNKKTGAKSKKDLREQVQTEAAKKLTEIAIKHGHVSGKWLIFAPSDKIDKIWNHIAKSLVSGPLSSTSAYLAKVATSPEQETSNYQHVICVYLPDVYSREKVTEVMRILLRNHGLNLSGVKSNLYTTLGIDSKHPSGIPSTTWKNTALMSEKEIKELKDAFYAELTSDKPPATEKLKEKEREVTLASRKPKPKKALDNPFASDEEADDREEEKRKEDLQAKTGKTKLKPKKVIDDLFVSDEDNDGNEEVKRRLEIQAKKASLTSNSRKRGQDDDDKDGEEERPFKRKANKS